MNAISMSLNASATFSDSSSASNGNINWSELSFVTADDAFRFYCDYAHSLGFSVRKMYERPKPHEVDRLFYLQYACNKEGFRRGCLLDSDSSCRSKSLKFRRSDETRTGCEAKVRLHYKTDEKVYRVVFFCGDHNHDLHGPSRKHMLKSNRRVDELHSVVAGIHEEVGLSLKSSYDLLSMGAGGSGLVGFLKDDLKNALVRRRQRNLKVGDAGVVLKYFSEKCVSNPFFFHEYDLDDDERITNIFWSDAEMRMDYQAFGDSVTFDTTYRTNKNYRPLAVFVGFNHHRQTSIFGAALMLDETQRSFEWLFKTFLKCMGDKAPQTIFTDQDCAMAPAIRKILPNTYHALCSWHIIENAKKNLSQLYTPRFDKLFHHLVYDVRTEMEFEVEWEYMLSTCFSQSEHRWLSTTYNLRSQWSAAWVKNHFTAGMRTTQLSESFNSVVKRFLRPVDNYVEFFAHFERVVESRRDNERMEDFKADDRQVSARFIMNPLLKYIAEKYTPNVFNIFNNEYDLSFGYVVELQPDALIYRVCKREDADSKLIGDHVNVNIDDGTIGCSCNMFENMGILCCHALRVMDILSGSGAKVFHTIPDKYILRRWSRNAKCDLSYVDVGVGKETNVVNATSRYRKLCGLFLKSAIVLSRNEDACESFMYDFETLMKTKYDNIDINKESEIGSTSDYSNLHLRERETCKGRKKSNKRMVSISEAVRKKKELEHRKRMQK